MKAQRIPPPVLFVLALVLVVVLHRYFPVASVIPSPWHYTGIALAALGVAFGVWPVVLFRRARTTIIPFQESSALITDGPYRLTRNPIYLGMVLLLIAGSVFAGSLSPFAVIPGFIVIIQRFFISTEEAMLVQRFPAQYTAYSAKVRRWL